MQNQGLRPCSTEPTFCASTTSWFADNQAANKIQRYIIDDMRECHSKFYILFGWCSAFLLVPWRNSNVLFVLWRTLFLKFPSRPASCPGIAASAPNMAVCLHCLLQTKSLSLIFCRLSLVSSGLGHCCYGLGNLRMGTHLGTSHGILILQGSIWFVKQPLHKHNMNAPGCRSHDDICWSIPKLVATALAETADCLHH